MILKIYISVLLNLLPQFCNLTLCHNYEMFNQNLLLLIQHFENRPVCRQKNSISIEQITKKNKPQNKKPALNIRWCVSEIEIWKFLFTNISNSIFWIIFNCVTNQMGLCLISNMTINVESNLYIHQFISNHGDLF